MRSFIMVRAVYGPDQWTLEANKRRLELTKGITAKSLQSQTAKDWTLVVMMDPDDPMYDERLGVFQNCSPNTVVINWKSKVSPGFSKATDLRSGVAASAYKGVDWGKEVESSVGNTLMLRLDDDDAMHPSVMKRLAVASSSLGKRSALIFPHGYRSFKGKVSKIGNPTNIMHCLFTPDGDDTHVYSYGHTKIKDIMPIISVNFNKPAWIYVRHGDAISGHRKADQEITEEIKSEFPIDWDLL